MMTSDLKPYPAYKGSGVEWLGEVPRHWEVRRLKQICRLAYGNTLTTEMRQDGTVPVFGSNGCVGFHSSANTKAPCIVVGRKGSFGKVNYSRDSVYAIDTTFFIDSRFSGAHIRWLFFLLGWLRLDEVTKDSAVPGLDREDAYQRLAPVPPLPEQTAIVRFLDHADRRIQRYIRAKQKLITLLEEQKQAIIHQAVTGQIDVQTGEPYPSYKNSGVEWLGYVPEHWEVRRARYIFREIDRRSPDGSEQHLSMSQSLGLVPSHLVENRTLVSENYAGGKLCRSGDLVLNRLKAHLGVFARAQQSGIISTDYTVLRPNREAKTEYFEQVLRSPSCRGELRTRAKGIVEGFWRLYTDDLYDIYLPLPTVDEQESIIRWIKSISMQAERNAALGDREIALLQEYRTRLIADVVTGKLDVREAAAELPEVDPLAEDDLDSTIHDRENPNLGELDAEKSAEEYTIEKEMPL